jgi:hypothetical protein
VLLPVDEFLAKLEDEVRTRSLKPLL